ncbi:MAG: hypothetical protein AAB325_05655, partial [Pseudomonadota bacterium]
MTSAFNGSRARWKTDPQRLPRLRQLIAGDKATDPRVHDLLGVVLTRQGRLAEAEREIKRALA